MEDELFFPFFLKLGVHPFFMQDSSTPLRSSDRGIIDSLELGGIERRKAEETLFTTYSYFIDQGVRQYSISRDEAFDAYSDSVLIGIRQLSDSNFEGRSSIKTWLYRIFCNKCVDLLRKKTTNKQSVYHTLPVSEMLTELSDSSKTIIQQLVQEADMELLRKRLAETGDRCRELLVRSAEGYSDRELSAELGYKSADVVKTSRLRCLEKLRQLYKTS